MEYRLSARMRIVNGGAPFLDLDAQAGARWRVDRGRNRTRIDTVDGPLSGISITLDPFRVCLEGIGCAP